MDQAAGQRHRRLADWLRATEAAAPPRGDTVACIVEASPSSVTSERLVEEGASDDIGKGRGRRRASLNTGPRKRGEESQKIQNRLRSVFIDRGSDACMIGHLEWSGERKLE